MCCHDRNVFLSTFDATPIPPSSSLNRSSHKSHKQQLRKGEVKRRKCLGARFWAGRPLASSCRLCHLMPGRLWLGALPGGGLGYDNTHQEPHTLRPANIKWISALATDWLRCPRFLQEQVGPMSGQTASGTTLHGAITGRKKEEGPAAGTTDRRNSGSKLWNLQHGARPLTSL
jgi:hypothetical protein